MKRIVFAILIFALLAGCSQKEELLVTEAPTPVPTPMPTIELTPEPSLAPKEYSYEVKYCVRAIVTLKNSLKDPSSLQVHCLLYDIQDDVRSVMIDYSAKNGLGGVNRSVSFVSDDMKFFTSTMNYDFDTSMQANKFDMPSSIVKSWSEDDGVDEDEVLELYNLFLETKDIELLKPFYKLNK